MLDVLVTEEDGVFVRLTEEGEWIPANKVRGKEIYLIEDDTAYLNSNGERFDRPKIGRKGPCYFAMEGKVCPFGIKCWNEHTLNAPPPPPTKMKNKKKKVIDDFVNANNRFSYFANN